MNSKVFHTDTIAAIATAMSDSGIGIIRVSGDEAIHIVDKISKPQLNGLSASKMNQNK